MITSLFFFQSSVLGLFNTHTLIMIFLNVQLKKWEKNTVISSLKILLSLWTKKVVYKHTNTNNSYRSWWSYIIRLSFCKSIFQKHLYILTQQIRSYIFRCKHLFFSIIHNQILQLISDLKYWSIFFRVCCFPLEKI